MDYRWALLGLLLFTSCLRGGGLQEPVADNVFEGEFRKVVGLTDELRCACENAGYVTTADGEEIPICFALLDRVYCDKIRVEANYELKQVVPPVNSPCPAGEMEIYKAMKFECIDEE